jgi:formylglycine-generating enzyme required for sulfatase activity/class 3 adenylate cyclase
MTDLPTGDVAFLFTDIEGYTRGFESAPKAMARAVARHDRIVGAAVAAAGGVIFKTIGDAFQIAFAAPGAAVAAAVAAQGGLSIEDWAASCDLPVPLRVRMAVDVVPARAEDGDYRTPRLNRIARLMASGHGGQVLVTEAAAGALGGRAPSGATLRPLGAHRLKDLREPVTAFQVVAPGMPDVTTPLKTAGPLTTRDRIVVVEPHAGGAAGTGGGRDVPSLLGELTAVIRGSRETVTLAPDEVRRLVQHRPADLAEYRLIRVAEWSQPRYQLDSRFVALTLLVDQGEDSAIDRWAPGERFDDLRALLAAAADPALVLLGPPGCGKSTLLRRLELDLAVDGVRGEGGAVSWFVPLNLFDPGGDGSAAPDPGAWLAGRWAVRYPDLPPLADLAAGGRLVLLLDGLNEMPHASPDDYRVRVSRWQHYVRALAEEAPGNRVLFTCRALDYGAPLSTPALRVPQVQVEPMTDAQVRDFLDVYAPALAPELWGDLEHSRHLDLVRSPYLARLFVEQAAAGPLVANQAALMTGFVRQSLRREIELGNPLLAPDTLLVARDVRRLVQPGGWATPYDLPRRGALLPGLEALAHAVQTGRGAPDGTQARVGYDTALGLLGDAHGADIVRAGVDLGVLDEDPAADEVLFFHQLLQEYFAARHMAGAPDFDRVAAPWRAGDAGAGLGEILGALHPADPLPLLPTTGWEETTVMAAAMAPDPDAFVSAVMDYHLVLAGRCAGEPDVRARLVPGTLDRLRRALADRSRDPAADLRARLAAGLVLGPLGDGRLKRRRGPCGDYLMPLLADIPGGIYVLGDDEPFEYLDQTWTDHQPRHTVALLPFRIARLPVTVAEWALFMAAGGYDEERWWDTPAGRAWRGGEGTTAGTHANIRNLLSVLRADPALCEQEHDSGRWSDEIYERWLRRLAMSDDALEAHLQEMYPGRRFTEPHFWRDARFNTGTQPVIGISWYEARAYCCWLAAQTGEPFRLPTEAEWEAAARGGAGRRYAYGDAFDPLRANCLATHLRQVAPVGIFPGGDTPEGVSDMTGNVYAWTSSAWGRAPETTAFPYPYRADDGREDPDAPLDMRRVIRGGSWYDYEPLTRAYARLDTYPGDRIRPSGVGLRVAC